MATTDEQVAANVANALADHDDSMIEQLAKSAALYSTAMEQTRKQSFDAAHESFESLLAITPQLEKAWIAYAQMEKRKAKTAGDTAGAYANCKAVLDRGLAANPKSFQIVQNLGLIALEYGYNQEAVTLLEQAAAMDSSCAPVLKWKQFEAAKASLVTA